MGYRKPKEELLGPVQARTKVASSFRLYIGPSGPQRKYTKVKLNHASRKIHTDPRAAAVFTCVTVEESPHGVAVLGKAFRFLDAGLPF